MNRVIQKAPFADALVAFGFRAERVDANDLPALRAALERTRVSDGRPQVLVCETLPGKGAASLEAYEKVHYVRAAESVWLQALAELK